MRCIHVVIGICAWLAVAEVGLADTTRIDSRTLLERLGGAAAPVVLDVRTEREFASGHVPGAINIPLQKLPEELDRFRADAADEQRELVVYCERGGRAARAEALLQQAGFSSVLHLEGDMSGWRRAKLPIAIPDPKDDSAAPQQPAPN